MSDAAAAPPPQRFPDGFSWGTATAAHQVEGNNWNNDWWAWEHTPASGCAEPSGDACDHFHRYPQDLALLAGLGFTSYRFSVEWSRIEPEEGEFSRAALDHYRRVMAACLEHGLAPVVTLHHFTSPRWLAAAGGWTDSLTAERFVRFAERTVGHLGDMARSICTFNEPNMVATIGYLSGQFPPGIRDRDERRRANDVFVDAHERAVPVIKAMVGPTPVGMTLAMQDLQIADGLSVVEHDQAQARKVRMLEGLEDPFLAVAASDDFLGVQTYTRERIDHRGAVGPAAGVATTLMGYEFWPAALEATIRRAWDTTDHTPLVVTENGVATDDDTLRIEYVRQALDGVLACLGDGIDVRGYTYWSALDNFEWALGYGPTFGLIAVDRTTQMRTVKPSARWLGAVARANALPPAERP